MALGDLADRVTALEAAHAAEESLAWDISPMPMLEPTSSTERAEDCSVFIDAWADLIRPCGWVYATDPEEEPVWTCFDD